MKLRPSAINKWGNDIWSQEERIAAPNN
jgi:hypothetical protein